MTWVTGTPRVLARSATLTTEGSSIGPASAARVAVAVEASARRSKASSCPRRPPRDWPGRLAGRERCIGLGMGRGSLVAQNQMLRVISQLLEAFLRNSFYLQRSGQHA